MASRRRWYTYVSARYLCQSESVCERVTLSLSLCLPVSLSLSHTHTHSRTLSQQLAEGASSNKRLADHKFKAAALGGYPIRGGKWNLSINFNIFEY